MFRTVRDNADLLVALSVVLGAGASLSIVSGRYGIWVLVVSLLMSVLYASIRTVLAIVLLIERRWWAAVRSVLKAVVLIGLFPACMALGDILHLAICCPYYWQQIGSAGGASTVRFDWGDKAMWAPEGLQQDTLVYDPTDTIASSVGTVREASPDFGIATRHLLGHFYVEHEFSR